MSVMQSIQNALNLTAEKLNVGLCMMDNDYRVVSYAGTSELLNKTKNMAPSSRLYVNDVYEDAENDCTWIRLKIARLQARYLVVEGTGEKSRVCGEVAAAMLQTLLKTDMLHPGKDEFIRELLLGEYDDVEAFSIARDIGFDMSVYRSAVLIDLPHQNADDVMEVVQNVFEDSDTGIAVKLNDSTIAVVIAVDDDEELEEIITAMDFSIEEEFGSKVHIGCGMQYKNLSGIEMSLKEARQAIEITKKLGIHHKTYFFRKLLIEKMLLDVPMDTARRTYAMVFSEDIRQVLSGELLNTVYAFFENDLNQSLTSKALDVHRNTLYYRIERIREITGMDLKNFYDANLLRLLLVLARYIYGPDDTPKRR